MFAQISQVNIKKWNQYGVHHLLQAFEGVLMQHGGSDDCDGIEGDLETWIDPILHYTGDPPHPSAAF
jgi:hypothetical protein